MLAKGVAKLYKVNEAQSVESAKKPSRVTSTTSSNNFGAQEGSVKRVFVVRSRENDENWRYGFAEYHSVEVRPRYILIVLL
jgi:RNA-binding protein 5/10